MHFLLTVAVALLRGAYAIPWPGPEATPTLNKPHVLLEGWSPATTGLAGVFGKGYELFKRQGFPTCGYISGISSIPVTCNTLGDVCATNSYYGAFGCCQSTDLLDCTLATSCIPYASASACGTACHIDAYATTCDSGAPYCQYDVFVFPNTAFTYFGCNSVAFVVTVYPTYSGGSVTASYSSFSIITVTVTPSSTGSSTTTSSSPTHSATSAASSTPAGAIAGGVVAGVVVLAAVGFGIFFLCWRRRPDAASGADGAAASGGVPPTDPKPPVNPYGAAEFAGVQSVAPGMAAAHPMPGVQPDYYGQPGAAPLPGKMAAVASTVPVAPSSPPAQHYMGYGHEGAPVGGYVSPQPVVAPLSPAPSYAAAMQQAGPIQPVPHSVSPPIGGATMIDGTQVWPGGPGVYEAVGSTPGDPHGR